MRHLFLFPAIWMALGVLTRLDAVGLVAGEPGEAGRPSQARPFPTATKWWYSGFENGFPGPQSANDGKGEWLNFQGAHKNFTKAGELPPSHPRGSAWTILHHKDSPITPYAGDYVYKGEVFRPDTESHRAYPGIDLPITLTKPMVNSFMVYLDLGYSQMGKRDWVSLATWSNTWWGRGLHTTSVLGTGKLEMAHMNKYSYVGPRPQPNFPLKKWVRITWYFNTPSDHGDGNGDVLVWQDGTLVFQGIHSAKSTDKATFHFGMYASGNVMKGVMYNDEVQFWTLSAPWPDPSIEPPSPYPVAAEVP
ncbi:MAG: hypothetical protein ACYTG0_28535 [Planctomycetota bacterium]|jgi:hypothetical protein